MKQDILGRQPADGRKPMEIAEDAEDDFNDVISTAIRDGTKGFALLAVVAVSTCMASISILLILQYTPPHLTTQSSATGESDQQCSMNQTLPLWADLLDKQIQVIQNLVHASLLGGSGFVAAFRGDAVWLYFARNCCFYFGLAAISYFSLDLAKGRLGSTSFIMSALLGSCCIAAFVKLEIVRHEVNRLVERYAQGHEGNYLKCLPSTRSQLVKTRIISRLAECLQVGSLVYVALTTYAAMLEEDCDSMTKVGLLEASYREGAHQAFLLSQLFLVATYPGRQASVCGAIFCSGWRTVLAIAYLFSLASTTFGARDILSLVASSVELILNAPILAAAFLLFNENLVAMSGSRSSKSATNVQYSRLEKDDDQHDNDDGVAAEEDEVTIRRIQSLSMYQISKSSNFVSRQRYGAFTMWMSSTCLLLGMTMECLLLLTTYDSNEVYQWGMHVCAMYLFCTHMSVTSPEVYNRARWLLAIACPAGSVVAAWQLWVLFGSIGGLTLDTWSLVASLLFTWRALCGIGQTVGLMLLRSTSPESVSSPDVTAPPELTTRLSNVRFTLFNIYIPALFLNVVWEAYSFDCSEPLLSPTTPECVQEFFLLAKSWPALGTFFHFGGLLVIFTADSMYATGSYPPSLAIATLFSLHVATLLVGDLAWTNFMSPLNSPQPSLPDLLLKLVWALAAAWLGILLNKMWKVRITEA